MLEIDLLLLKHIIMEQSKRLKIEWSEWEWVAELKRWLTGSSGLPLESKIEGICKASTLIKELNEKLEFVHLRRCGRQESCLKDGGKNPHMSAWTSKPENQSGCTLT